MEKQKLVSMTEEWEQRQEENQYNNFKKEGVDSI